VPTISILFIFIQAKRK